MARGFLTQGLRSSCWLGFPGAVAARNEGPLIHLHKGANPLSSAVLRDAEPKQKVPSLAQ
jgi:hypothetical protein